MFFLVLGILQAGVNNTLLVVFLAIGVAFLAGFFFYIRSRERAGKVALLSTELFRNRISNLGLITQNLQWLLLMGVSFTVSVFLQTERHYNAIKTGVIFTAATVGVLVSSLAAERLAKKYAQKTLIAAGFVMTAAGIGLLLGLVKAASSSAWAFAPGLLLIGLGLGVMLTPSVNLVQSAFPEEKQGEISGLSRSISNLGSSFGTAIAGHDPGLEPRLGKRHLRRGDDRSRRRRPRRACHRDSPTVQPLPEPPTPMSRLPPQPQARSTPRPDSRLLPGMTVPPKPSGDLPGQQREQPARAVDRLAAGCSFSPRTAARS